MKVFVDGIPRVVCGVTEETTCQEVVLALAQALGMFDVFYMVVKVMLIRRLSLILNSFLRSTWALHITGEI